jgi:hypothetical protein
MTMDVKIGLPGGANIPVCPGLEVWRSRMGRRGGHATNPGGRGAAPRSVLNTRFLMGRVYVADRSSAHVEWIKAFAECGYVSLVKRILQ